jgi:hypothetical protein
VPVFGNTKPGWRISKSANFQDLPNAIGTLWQVLFGDEWHTIVDDLGVRAPACTPASAGVLLPTGEAFDDCGDRFAPILFFIVFRVVVAWWLLQVFTGVLVHRFSFCAAQYDEDRALFSESDVRALRGAWDACDSLHLGFIPTKELYALFRRFPESMGLRILGRRRSYLRDFLPLRLELGKDEDEEEDEEDEEKEEDEDEDEEEEEKEDEDEDEEEEEEDEDEDEEEEEDEEERM